VYKHSTALLSFAWMTAVLMRANDLIRLQAGRHESRRVIPPLYPDMFSRHAILTCHTAMLSCHEIPP